MVHGFYPGKSHLIVHQEATIFVCMTVQLFRFVRLVIPAVLCFVAFPLILKRDGVSAAKELL